MTNRNLKQGYEEKNVFSLFFKNFCVYMHVQIQVYVYEHVNGS